MHHIFHHDVDLVLLLENPAIRAGHLSPSPTIWYQVTSNCGWFRMKILLLTLLDGPYILKPKIGLPKNPLYHSPIFALA